MNAYVCVCVCVHTSVTTWGHRHEMLSFHYGNMFSLDIKVIDSNLLEKFPYQAL